MNKRYKRVGSRFHLIALTADTFALLCMLSVAQADEYSQLKGYWQCQEDSLGLPTC